MSIPARDDPRFGPLPLPEQVKEIRPQQWEVVEESIEAFRSGDDVVFVEAPTGAGKSVIAELLRRELKTNAAYCCTTKALQDQLVESFPYGKVIKGRANYYTELGNVDEDGRPWGKPWSAITAADCTWNEVDERCRWCAFRGTCPYQVAKRQARDAELAILNTSYYMTDVRFAGNFRDRGLVVLDECDLVEDEILSQVGVEISPRRLSRMRLGAPEGRGSKTKPVMWASWMHNEAIPTITSYVKGLVKPWEPGAAPRDIKEYNEARELLGKLGRIKEEIAKGNWIYDGYDDGGRVRFSPVLIDGFGETILWPTGKKFLLMSATILSADLMAEDLGLYLPYASISVPSTFPLANRPIYVVPVADMSFKAKEEIRGGTWKTMVDGIRAVLRRHPNERVLIHTVSYDLAKFIKEQLKLEPSPPTEFSRREIITYTQSNEKARALRLHAQSKNGVLIAASMDRGIDLPDDLCRVQIIAKVPFMNYRRDKRVNARLHTPGGTHWYKSQAIRTLIQMCGRGVRHENDFAWTYILDKQFADNLWKSSFLFPTWFTEAMVWNLTAHQLLHTK